MLTHTSNRDELVSETNSTYKPLKYMDVTYYDNVKCVFVFFKINIKDIVVIAHEVRRHLFADSSFVSFPFFLICTFGAELS